MPAVVCFNVINQLLANYLLLNGKKCCWKSTQFSMQPYTLDKFVSKDNVMSLEFRV